MESKTATSWDALFERTAAGTGCTNGRFGYTGPGKHSLQGDGVRVCIWRLEQKKINQKINKTLKSLQSTEPNPAATSSSFTQKDSRLLWVDEADSKYSAGEAECTSEEHVCFIWG